MFSILVPVGSFDNPGISCKHIADNKIHSLVDGRYWIQPPGLKQMPVYCDMTTDEGRKEYFVILKNLKSK